MNYSKEAIQHLTALIKGDDTSRAWLQKNNFPELILLHYSLENNEAALKELTQKKNIELVAFAHAVLDDKRAFNWLAENKKFTWAATARVTYKDNNAEAWLMRNNLSHYAELGRAIRKNEENEQADDIFGLIGKFVRFLKSKVIKTKKKIHLKKMQPISSANGTIGIMFLIQVNLTADLTLKRLRIRKA